jgi:hypothetical protein
MREKCREEICEKKNNKKISTGRKSAAIEGGQISGIKAKPQMERNERSE